MIPALKGLRVSQERTGERGAGAAPSSWSAPRAPRGRQRSRHGPSAVRFGPAAFQTTRFSTSLLPGGASGKEPAAHAADRRDRGWSLGPEEPLEAGTATHSSVGVWRSPWTGGPGRRQSTGLKELGVTAVA